jgi:predicted ATP-dependent endonuclease of OLD family
MKLRSIRVQNYKLCRDVQLNINDSLTVLLGKNGSGKTTLLNALAFLNIRDISPSSSRRFAPRDYDISNVEAEIEDGKSTHTLFVDVYFDKNSIPTNPRHIEYRLSVNGAKPIPYNDYDYFFYTLEELKAGNSSGQSKQYEKMDQVKKYLNNIAVVETTDFLHGGENDTILDVSSDAYAGRFRKANKKFLLDLYGLKASNPTGFERYRGVVSRTGSGLIDNIEFNSITIPKSSVKAYKNGKLTTVEESRDLVVPIFSIGQNKLYSNQLSEGTFRVLALIFYTMNDDSDILLIEEPELSIHVNLLADVMELIKETAKQRCVILSTHSEKIVNMLALEDITIINRGDHGIEAKTISDKFNEKNLESLKRYLVDGGTLGEFLLGDEL